MCSEGMSPITRLSVNSPSLSRAIPKDPAARFRSEANLDYAGNITSHTGCNQRGRRKLGGESIASALHGDWMHHPLHAVLTDIPIGAWTATVACNAMASLTGSTAMDTAADATVVVGLIGAAGAPTTGMTGLV